MSLNWIPNLLHPGLDPALHPDSSDWCRVMAGAASATSSLSGDGHSRSITPELATEDDPEVNASPDVKLFPMFRPKSQRKVWRYATQSDALSATCL